MKCDYWFDDKHKPEQCKNVAIWNLKIDKKGLSGWENDKAKFVIVVKPQWMVWLVKWVSPSLLYIKVIPKRY